MSYIVLGFLLVLGFFNQVWAEKRLPLLTDLYKIQQVDEPELSPDGQWVVYSVHRLNQQTNKDSTNLWLISVKSKKTKQITFSLKGNNTLPKWSPNGQWIAYLSDQGDHAQVWLYTVKTGKNTQLTHFNADISDFSWSPDSKELALIAEDTSTATEDGDPIVINRYDFKDDEEGYLTGSRDHLYLYNLKTKTMSQLTTGNHDEFSPAWSPNGNYIAYVSKRGVDPDRNYNYDIYLIQPHQSSSERQITHYRGSDMSPELDSSISWSPDSSKLAYLRTQEGKWYYYAPSQLTVVDLNSGQEALLAPIDRWFSKPHWSADGKSIYALVEQNKNTYLNRIKVKTGQIEQLTKGLRYDQNFTVNKDNIILVSSDDQHPPELFLLNDSLSQLTQHNKSLLDRVIFQPAEDFSFKNSDGLVIDGLLIKPRNFIKGQKTPAIIYLHGGPVDQYSHAFDFELQWFAANGYIVVAPNPRGSSGKGLDFSKAIYADWGNRDVKDVLEAVDYLCAEGILDPNRIAVGGWSYGGILTNYIIARDQRFKAAISGAATGNILANYGVDQYTYDYEQELGKPWQNQQAYLKLSYPFMNANRIKTPTLFLCGQLDFNVPCEGSEQLYQALKSLNVPAQLIIYPEEHHVLNTPHHISDSLKRYTEWLNQYLK
ncbi:S9 family peptidase [Legionella sp. km772]|uniref:S9 family peptidase n=1 Tax=Legionella sp. km772 TaxID=2498111 RepID=UPI000F8CF608|nr:S9 family peptidase [Legionella sp. km772]RUR12489.1 S9 family peptidase [Legionella sp. km772]